MNLIEVDDVFSFHLQEPGAESIVNKDGVAVDEFGLPQIPSKTRTS